MHDQDVAFQKMQNRWERPRLQQRMNGSVSGANESERPKVLIVGDITFNGEYQSFIELAEFFKRIEAFETTVLVGTWEPRYCG